MAGRLDTLTAPLAGLSGGFSTEGARLLVVDDNAMSRESICDIIEALGMKAEAACSGAEALAMLQAQRFEAVLTDLKMPGMSGVELLRAIKSRDPFLPVVVVTAFPSINVAIETMRQGASDFLTKPFDMSLIDHVVKKVLRERSLILRNQQLQAELNQKAVIETLNRQLREKVEELTKLYAISELMNKAVGNETLLQQIVRVASDITGCEKASLMLVDRDQGVLVIRAAVGLSREVILSTRQRLGEGIAGKVAQTKKTLLSNRFGVDDETPPKTRGRSYQYESFLSAPILVGDEVFGVLNLTDKHDGTEFTEADEELVWNLTQKAAIKLENNALYEGIYSNLVDTLRALVITIEARDPYTRSHSRRVTDYAMILGQSLGLGEDDMESVGFAGILHDIGKIGVQDQILHKPGSLTIGEYAMIKKHPGIGDMIVKPLGLIETERSIIRHHHERLDGMGYPDGLGGADIPLVVRILSVADSFDAMTTERPYRRAKNSAEALIEMYRCAGTQFDPAVVSALNAALQEGRICPTPSLPARFVLAG